MSATFSCRSNSHPFQERRVSLTEPAKIGRSVARARPAVNNAIFDCKVLSRNHALLWYEDGKFFLKDTKSSNGTFVNNRRLSEGSQESAAFEVNSGDIVQFGVDVVENSRRVTHGCIISQIRLYLPNGEEAKQSDVSVTSKVDKVSHSQMYPTLQSQDLYQLHDYLKEALHREQMLEQKLVVLQRHITDSQDTSEKGWQALIDEDKLLSRLEFLENQLQTYSKTLSEEAMQKELCQLQEEKHNYETTSKKALQLVLSEKLEVQQKLGNLERSYSNAEDECTHLRDTLAKAQGDLRELAGTHQKLVTESQDVEKARQEEKRRFEIEMESYQQRIERLEESEKDLQQRLRDSLVDIERYQGEVQELQGEIEKSKSSSKSCSKSEDSLLNEASRNDTASLKDKLNNIINNEGKIDLPGLDSSLINSALIDTDSFNELKPIVEHSDNPAETEMSEVNINLADYGDLQSSEKPKLENSNDENQDDGLISKLQDRIAELESIVSDAQLSHKVEEAKRKEIESKLEEIEKDRISEKEMLMETTRELQAALSEREKLLDHEEKLRARVAESEKLLKSCDSDSISSSSEAEDSSQKEEEDGIMSGSLAIAKAKLKELKKKLKEKESELYDTKVTLDESTSDASQKSSELDKVVKLLKESDDKIINLEAEILTLRTVSEQSTKLQSELEEARARAKEQCELYEDAQLKIQTTLDSERDLKEMKDQLENEKRETETRLKEVEELLSSSNEKQGSYDAIIEEKSKLEASMKEYLEQIARLKQFEQDSIELGRENEKLAEKNDQLQKSLNLLHEQLDTQPKAQANSEITKEVEDLKSRLEAARLEYINLQKEKKTGGDGIKAPIMVAVLAILVGIGYLVLRSG